MLDYVGNVDNTLRGCCRAGSECKSNSGGGGTHCGILCLMGEELEKRQRFFLEKSVFSDVSKECEVCSGCAESRKVDLLYMPMLIGIV